MAKVHCQALPGTFGAQACLPSRLADLGGEGTSQGQLCLCRPPAGTPKGGFSQQLIWLLLTWPSFLHSRCPGCPPSDLRPRSSAAFSLRQETHASPWSSFPCRIQPVALPEAQPDPWLISLEPSLL